MTKESNQPTFFFFFRMRKCPSRPGAGVARETTPKLSGLTGTAASFPAAGARAAVQNWAPAALCFHLQLRLDFRLDASSQSSCSELGSVAHPQSDPFFPPP